MLDNIKITKVSKPDGVALRILREVKDYICKVLATIFNKSVNRGKVPRD